MPLTIKRTNSTSIAANSVQFNGSSQYLTLPASSNWEMTGNFTVECWVNTNLPSNYSGTILSLGSNSSAYAGLRFQITRASSGATPVSLEILIATNGGSWGLTGATSGLMVNGEWNHVAVVRSSGVVTAYINGVGYNIGTINGTLYAGPYNSIGKLDGYSNPFYYNGYISNLRVVNGTAVYTSNFTPPTSPLTAIANTSLLTCNAATIVDSSTNNFAITNNGAATVSSLSPFLALSNNFQFARRASTLSAKSVQFNGSNYLSLTPNSSLAFGTNNFTVEMWIYPTSISAGADTILIEMRSSNNGKPVYAIHLQSALGTNTGAGAAYLQTATGVITTNSWQHIAYVRNSGTLTIYVNGVSKTSTSDAGAYTYDVFKIGSGLDNSYTGYISNLRIVNGTALYTASFTPTTTPLTAIANTALLTCNADTIVDSSTNNFTITNNNGATVSSTSPFVASSGGMSLKKVYADPIVFIGTQKAIFGYGLTSTYVSMTNLVSNTGVVATDTTGVGTQRAYLAAAGYGTDKAIFGYGLASGYVSMTNLVNNTGVVSTDTTGVGTARVQLAAVGYGRDKSIFGYGYNSSGVRVSITNLVSNVGVVATDTTGVGNARYALAAIRYGGGGQAMFAYGQTDGNNNALSTINLVSDTGVVASDTTAADGSPRRACAGADYGGDKGILGFGLSGGSYMRSTNLVSNTGVIASDTANYYSSGNAQERSLLAASGYGGDKAIFGFGEVNSTRYSITNLVSNTGVVASNTANSNPTSRYGLAAAGYSLT
jgi:hypothetical protein